jgi:ankyrin repeat protein
MFHNAIKRYHFYQHYIDTDKKLSEDELKLLGQSLSIFPNGARDRNWEKKFSDFKSDKVSKKILLLLANAYDSAGNTMLGVAAEKGNVPALQRLIDMKANLDKPDNNMNKTPLYWAICNKLSYKDKNSLEAAEVVKCLLENGAKTNICCSPAIPGECLPSVSQDQTPLQYAKNRGYKAAESIIEEHLKKQEKLSVVL